MSATAPTTLPVLALNKRYAEEFTRRVLAEVDEVGNCVGLVAGKWHVSIPVDVELDRFDDPLERLEPGLETQVIDKGKPHDCFGLRP